MWRDPRLRCVVGRRCVLPGGVSVPYEDEETMTPEHRDILRAVNKATIMARSRSISECGLRNLPRLAGKPCVTRAAPELGEVLVVGAGPSLDRTIDALRVRALAGAHVFSVNTAAPALHEAGIPIDLLVACESVDVSEHVRPARAYALETATHAAVWDAAEATGAPVSWFVTHSPHTLEWCEALSIEPLYFGGAAITAAAAIAHRWGASSIVLVGVDLAYLDGKSHAATSGWGGQTVEVDEAGTRIKFIGRYDRDETHWRSGVPAITRERNCYSVPGVRGTTVTTTPELMDQAEWFRRAAESWSAGTPPPHALDPLPRVNASQGAALEGWAEVYLTELPGVLPAHSSIAAALAHATATTDAEVETLTEHIAEAATHTERLSLSILLGQQLDYYAYRTSPFVDGFASKTILEAREAGAKLRDMLTVTYEALAEGAAYVTSQLRPCPTQPTDPNDTP